MKILHIITDLRTGGAEKLMVDILPRLRDLGNEVELLCQSGIETPFYKELQAKGIKIRNFGIGSFMYNPCHIVKLVRLLKQEHYDIVHTHNTPPQFLAAVASLFVDTAFFTTEHSTENRRRSLPLFKMIDCWMYGRYKRVICISDKADSNLRAYLGENNAGNICTVYNGVDVERFAEAKPDTTLYAECKNKHAALMVASFSRPKDQATVIRACALLPDDFHTYFAGVGPCESDCRKLAEELNVAGRVHFLGMRTDIPALLKSVEVVILSSHFEGLSLSSIEGMASGKPFVASDVNGLREVVKGYGLLFKHEDAHGLADIWHQLAMQPDFRAQVATKCQMRASQFDVAEMVKKYDALYRQYC